METVTPCDASAEVFYQWQYKKTKDINFAPITNAPSDPSILIISSAIVSDGNINDLQFQIAATTNDCDYESNIIDYSNYTIVVDGDCELSATLEVSDPDLSCLDIVGNCNIGASCNDGDICTINDVWTIDANEDCLCLGGELADNDGDGICNTIDICPNGDDNIDTDSDGIPDACECPIPQSCQATESITINFAISSGNDDFEELQNGNAYIGSSDLELTFDPNTNRLTQKIGLFFNSINIPPGAIIQEASVQFTVDENDRNTTNGPNRLEILTELNASPTPFNGNGDNQITNLSLSSGRISWSPPSWDGQTGESGSNQQTPNIASIVQEVVDLPNWNENNSAIKIIITGTGNVVAVSADDAIGVGAAVLTVTYSEMLQAPDEDNDGVCDAEDICEGFSDCADFDNDGIPDGCDTCNVGMPCVAADPCYRDGIVVMINEVCGCEGIFIDSDEDGVCDEDDLCPGFDDSLNEDNNGLPDCPYFEWSVLDDNGDYQLVSSNSNQYMASEPGNYQVKYILPGGCFISETIEVEQTNDPEISNGEDDNCNGLIDCEEIEYTEIPTVEWIDCCTVQAEFSGYCHTDQIFRYTWEYKTQLIDWTVVQGAVSSTIDISSIDGLNGLKEFDIKAIAKPVGLDCSFESLAEPSPYSFGISSSDCQIVISNEQLGSCIGIYSWEQLNDVNQNWQTVSDNTNVFNVEAEGTYRAVFTSSAGCTYISDNETIIEIPTCDTYDPIRVDCQNTEATIGFSSSSNVSYEWSTIDGNILSGQASSQASINSGGTYTLMITNLTSGCSTACDFQVLEDTTLPVANAGFDGGINCANPEFIRIGLSDIETAVLTWEDENGNQVSDNETLTVNQAGSYTLLATDQGNACVSIDVVTITENFNIPDLTILDHQEITCDTPETTLTGSSNTSSTFFQWLNSDTDIVSTTESVTVSAEGWYTFRVQNTRTGCKSSKAVFVRNLNSTPDCYIPEQNLSIPFNSSITLLGLSDSYDVSYSWTSVGGNIVSGGDTQTPVIDKAGEYFFKVSYNATGCFSTCSVIVSQCLQSDLPTGNISGDLSTNCPASMDPNQNISLEIEPCADCTFTWSPEPTTGQGTNSITISDLNESKVYTVTLENDCGRVSYSQSITVNSENQSEICDGIDNNCNGQVDEDGIDSCPNRPVIEWTSCTNASFFGYDYCGNDIDYTYQWQYKMSPQDEWQNTGVANEDALSIIDVINQNTTLDYYELQLLVSVGLCEVESNSLLFSVAVATNTVDCKITANLETDLPCDQATISWAQQVDADGVFEWVNLSNQTSVTYQPLATGIYRATFSIGTLDDNIQIVSEQIDFSLENADGDLASDCNDECPDDPNKILAGFCGCGVDESECTDCLGIPNGTAYLDNCDNCIESNMVIPDADFDGYPETCDCNDNNPNVNPGATEILENAVDENCDNIAACTPIELEVFPENINLCGGDSYIFNAVTVSQNVSFEWYENGVKLDLPINQDFIQITPTANTTIELKAINSCNDVDSTSTMLTLNGELPTIAKPGDLNGHLEAYSICNANPTVINLTVEQATIYTWSQRDINSAVWTELDPNIVVDESTITIPSLNEISFFRLQVMNDCGSDETSFLVNPNPVDPVLLFPIGPYCPGEPLEFSVNEDYSGQSFEWTFTDGTSIENNSESSITLFDLVSDKTLTLTTIDACGEEHVLTRAIDIQDDLEAYTCPQFNGLSLQLLECNVLELDIDPCFASLVSWQYTDTSDLTTEWVEMEGRITIDLSSVPNQLNDIAQYSYTALIQECNLEYGPITFELDIAEPEVIENNEPELVEDCNTLAAYTVLQTPNIPISNFANTSGMTYNTDDNQIVVISDKSEGVSINTGMWVTLGINQTSGNGNNATEFNDTEAITYIEGNTYAIGEERERKITIVEFDENDSQLLYPNSLVQFNLGTFANNGLEGLAYDPLSNIMFYALEDTRSIYAFPYTPDNVNVNPQNIFTLPVNEKISGLAVNGNGHLLALINETSILEFDENYEQVGSIDLTSINGLNTTELQAITVINNQIAVTGENNTIYRIAENLLIDNGCNPPPPGPAFCGRIGSPFARIDCPEDFIIRTNWTINDSPAVTLEDEVYIYPQTIGTYVVSYTLESGLIAKSEYEVSETAATVSAPNLNAEFVLPGGSTVASISNNINYKWYDQSFNEIQNTTVLSDNHIYYVSQIDGFCESVLHKISVMLTTTISVTGTTSACGEDAEIAVNFISPPVENTIEISLNGGLSWIPYNTVSSILIDVEAEVYQVQARWNSEGVILIDQEVDLTSDCSGASASIAENECGIISITEPNICSTFTTRWYYKNENIWIPVLEADDLLELDLTTITQLNIYINTASFKAEIETNGCSFETNELQFANSPFSGGGNEEEPGYTPYSFQTSTAVDDAITHINAGKVTDGTYAMSSMTVEHTNGATIDDNAIDNAQWSAKYGIHLGVNLPSIDGSQISTIIFDQEMPELCFFINDIDDFDGVSIQGVTQNGQSINFSDYTFIDPSTGINFIAPNTFHSTSGVKQSNTNAGGINICFDQPIIQLKITFFGINTSDGGSYTISDFESQRQEVNPPDDNDEPMGDVMLTSGNCGTYMFDFDPTISCDQPIVTSFKWYLNDELVSTNEEIIPEQVGEYTLTATLSNNLKYSFTEIINDIEGGLPAPEAQPQQFFLVGQQLNTIEYTVEENIDYLIFDVPQGGNPVPTNSLLESRFYYIEALIEIDAFNDCTSERTKVSIVLLPNVNFQFLDGLCGNNGKIFLNPLVEEISLPTNFQYQLEEGGEWFTEIYSDETIEIEAPPGVYKIRTRWEENTPSAEFEEFIIENSCSGLNPGIISDGCGMINLYFTGDGQMPCLDPSIQWEYTVDGINWSVVQTGLTSLILSNIQSEEIRNISNVTYRVLIESGQNCSLYTNEVNLLSPSYQLPDNGNNQGDDADMPDTPVNEGDEICNTLENYEVDATLSISGVPEIAGLTYNPITKNFVLVSDRGFMAIILPPNENTPAGEVEYNRIEFEDQSWSDYYYLGTGSDCQAREDTEAITYIGSNDTGTLHKYAIVDERKYTVTIIEINHSENSIVHSGNYILLTEPDFDRCGNNNLEGIAYDNKTGYMYVAREASSRTIYRFLLPDNVEGRVEIDPEVYININNYEDYSLTSLHALSINPLNGNLLVVATIFDASSSDNGDLDRIVLEVKTGNQPSIVGGIPIQELPGVSANATDEIEAIIQVNNTIYLSGELLSNNYINLESDGNLPPACEDQNGNDNIDIGENPFDLTQVDFPEPCSEIDRDPTYDQSTQSISISNFSDNQNLAGLTYNPFTDQFVGISRNGELVNGQSDTWNSKNINIQDGCNPEGYEGITYIQTIDNDTHVYGICSASNNSVYIIYDDQNNNQITASKKIELSGFNSSSCSNSNGLTGIVFNNQSNKIFVAKRKSNQTVYEFALPDLSNNNQVTINPAQTVSIEASENNFGLTILDNGNLGVLIDIVGQDAPEVDFTKTLWEVVGGSRILHDLYGTAGNDALKGIHGITSRGKDLFAIGKTDEQGVPQLIRMELQSNLTDACAITDFDYDECGTLSMIIEIPNCDAVDVATIGWYLEGNELTQFSNQLDIIPQVSGIYTAVIQLNNGLILEIEELIQGVSSNEPPLIDDSIFICEETAVISNLNSLLNASNLLWSYNGEALSNTAVVNSGTYDVSEIRGSCISDSKEVFVKFDKPSFTLEPDAEEYYVGEPIMITASNISNCNECMFDWVGFENDNATLTTIAESNQQTISLKITNENGCDSTYEINITVLDAADIFISDVIDATCDTDGAIIIDITDNPNESNIQISIDGGGSLETYEDNIMSVTISAPPEEYHVRARISEGLSDNAFGTAFIDRDCASGNPVISLGGCGLLGLNNVDQSVENNITWYYIEGNGTRQAIQFNPEPDNPYIVNLSDAVQAGARLLSNTFQASINPSGTVSYSQELSFDLNISYQACGQMSFSLGESSCNDAISSVNWTSQNGNVNSSSLSIPVLEADTYFLTLILNNFLSISAEYKVDPCDCPAIFDQDFEQCGCPNGEIPNTACDDNDPCTTQDVWIKSSDGSCLCSGQFNDSDNDTICDAKDICPDGDDLVDIDNDGIPDDCECDAPAACTIEQEMILISQISNGDDDIEELADASLYQGSTDLEFFRDNNRGEQIVGLYFNIDNAINLPSDAAITNAYIQFTADETDTEATMINIAAEKSSDPINFENVNLSARVQTDAQVSWSPNLWTANDALVAQQTPDLSRIIQELIDQQDWSSSSNIVFILSGTGQRVAESYEGSVEDHQTTERSARLIIEYSTQIQDEDTDGDGICDSEDQCPGVSDCIDKDGDGTPDCNDSCVVGDTCDDEDPCTTNDVFVDNDGNCACQGTLLDDDGDGVCNALDECEGYDDSIDEDGDGIPDCLQNSNLIEQACDLFSHLTIDRLESNVLLLAYESDFSNSIEQGDESLMSMDEAKGIINSITKAALDIDDPAPYYSDNNYES